MAGDLADPGFRQALWERAQALPGGVDLLVNNAGLGNYAEFTEQDPAAIRQIIELNLMALIDLSQKAARHMKARGAGQILQISSVLGFVGIGDSAVYVASKHAVNGLVKSLRYELAGTGVRVWAACPGRTVSEFSAAAGGAARARLVAGTGADRAGRARDPPRAGRPPRLRLADLARLAGRHPGVLAPRPVRLADDPARSRFVPQARQSARDRLLDRADEVGPLALRLQLGDEGLRVGLLGIVERRDGPAADIADRPDHPHPRRRGRLRPPFGVPGPRGGPRESRLILDAHRLGGLGRGAEFHPVEGASCHRVTDPWLQILLTDPCVAPGRSSGRWMRGLMVTEGTADVKEAH